MDRNWAGTRGKGDPARQPSSEDIVLPSRGEAIERLRAAVPIAEGPLLVTGEAGVGKTWLWRRLQAEMTSPWRWASVDLTPATDATEFFRLIGYDLGLSGRADLGESRRELADFLTERCADGDRWVLVVDEAQNLSISVAEEVRVLANRLGRSDGLAGLLLVGQTALGRRLSTRPLAALGARLAVHVHLRPLDIEEASELLSRLPRGRSWEGEWLERQHRDTGGNPRRLLRAMPAEAPETPSTPRAGQARLIPSPARATPPGDPPAPPVPDWGRSAVGASKPPLRVEEGVIEVGWEPPSATEPDQPPSAAPQLRSDRVAETSTVATESDEAIDDHYAALQAWNEWSQNQGRTPTSDATAAEPASGGPADDLGPLPDEPHPAGVRPEGQHEFAPYSQLFSRLRPMKDAE
jgi:type II secretory pathway predicted ATPase ExeA